MVAARPIRGRFARKLRSDWRKSPRVTRQLTRSLSLSLVVQGVGCVVGWKGGGVHRVAALVHDGVEAVVVVSGVGDCADRAVGLHQAVLTLHYIPVALLPLVLHIPRVVVLHAVVVRVLGV